MNWIKRYLYGRCLAGILFVALVPLTSQAQELVQYKQVDTTRLFLEVLHPPRQQPGKKYPAMVFFHGGGWRNGNRTQFDRQANYFSERGMVCFLVDYRIGTRDHTTPFDALKDAKSAMRYVRANAEEFGIDPGRVVAAGGSAGGHLAAACALVEKYNESSDDLSVSPVPDALVLFNPVIDNGPAGFGYAQVGEEYRFFSPLHNIRRGAPPCIIFLGTEDRLIPVETAEYFKKAMEKLGGRCDLKLYEGQEHGFFNFKNYEYFKATVLESDQFLQSIGYLQKEPRVDLPRKN